MTAAMAIASLWLGVAGDPPAACLDATHDCLTAGGVGCSDVACCEAVCAVDSFCCTVAWDGVCVGEALSLCDSVVGCGVTPHPCNISGPAGCDDAACCEAVCALHPTCCTDSWDIACIDGAVELCGLRYPPYCDESAPKGAVVEPEPCGESTNPGCNGAADSGSNCCVPGGGPWCDDPECMGVVCGYDPFCCMVAWDQICANESVLLCPTLCAIANPLTSPIELGSAVCGVTTEGNGTLDHDWYALTLADITEVVVTLTSDVPLTFGIADTDGIIDCTAATELDPVDNSVPSAPTALSACLEPGTHWIVVRPYPWTPGRSSCDNGLGKYLLEVDAGRPGCALPDPPNETCATALEIVEGSTPVSTLHASTEDVASDLPCLTWIGEPIARDVWYRFEAPRDGTVRVTACGTSTFYAVLAAYAGSCEQLELLACDDGGAACPYFDPEIDLDVQAGSTYHLQVGSHALSAGDAVLSVSFLPCTPQYGLEVITPPAPYTHLSVSGLSNDGEIIGAAGPGSSQLKPFRWTAGTGYEQLSDSTQLIVRDVSAEGIIVGQSGSFPSPMKLVGGQVFFLPGLPTCVSGTAVAINDDGAIAGKFTAASCPPMVVVWNDDVPTTFAFPPAATEPTAIDAFGNLAGWGTTATGFASMKGWVFANGRFEWVDPPRKGVGLQLLAMNDNGTAAGQLVLNLSHNHALFSPILWRRGLLEAIDVPAPFVGGRTADVNNEETTVLELDLFDSPTSARRPYVRRDGGSPLHLNELIGPLDEHVLRSVVAINGSGRIAGTARKRSGESTPQFGYLLTPNAPTGDLDCDGTVDGSDLAMLLGSWGACQTNMSCNADFTLDGVVDGADLAVVLGGWGEVRRSR